MAHLRHQIRQIEVRKALVRAWVAVGRPEPRDGAILLGLALIWFGLRDVYKPAAPIAVGCFILWFTTIRKVA